MKRIALFATAAALALSIALPTWAQAPTVSKATADVEASWQQDVADLSANAADLRARLTMDKPGTSDYARDQLDAARPICSRRTPKPLRKPSGALWLSSRPRYPKRQNPSRTASRSLGRSTQR